MIRVGLVQHLSNFVYLIYNILLDDGKHMKTAKKIHDLTVHACFASALTEKLVEPLGVWDVQIHLPHVIHTIDYNVLNIIH